VFIVVKAWKNHSSILRTMLLMMLKKIFHDAIFTLRLCGKSSHISCFKKDKTILWSTFAALNFAYAKIQC